MSLGPESSRQHCGKCRSDQPHVAEKAGVRRCTRCGHVSASWIAPPAAVEENGQRDEPRSPSSPLAQEKASEKNVASRAGRSASPKGSTTGSSTGPTSGPQSGSSTGSSTGSSDPIEVRCDGTLHGSSLTAFDADERLIDFALAAAGLDTLLDKHQSWTIAGHSLAVSKWWNEENGNFALRVWAGCPVFTGAAKAPDSVDPAAVYSYARTGTLGPLTPSARAKHKLRLMLDVGVIARPEVNLPQLPADARESEQAVWALIKEIVEIDRTCDCHPPGTPIVAAASFVATLASLNKDIVKDALRRLRRRRYLRKIGTTKIPGSHPANLYSVLGDGHHDIDPPPADEDRDTEPAL